MYKIQRYGWKPDLPDIRDYMVKAPAPNVVLPDQVSLEPQFQPPYDQGDLGSCTANAIAGVLEFDMRKQQEAKAATPSRLFIYYNERVMEHAVHEDAGAQIRDGIKSVVKKGAPPETDWPYIEAQFATKPTKKAYADAKLNQAIRYERLDNKKIDNLRACLAGGFPFVFGFTVYDYFESDQMAKDGILKMPGPDEQVQGGHAVVGCGYDHTKQMILVRNSWGMSWGQSGYFWMPYDYISNPNLADDFWVVKQVE